MCTYLTLSWNNEAKASSAVQKINILTCWSIKKTIKRKTRWCSGYTCHSNKVLGSNPGLASGLSVWKWHVLHMSALVFFGYSFLWAFCLYWCRCGGDQKQRALYDPNLYRSNVRMWPPPPPQLTWYMRECSDIMSEPLTIDEKRF